MCRGYGGDTDDYGSEEDEREEEETPPFQEKRGTRERRWDKDGASNQRGYFLFSDGRGVF